MTPVTTTFIQNDESSIVDTAANDHIQTGNGGVRVTKNNGGDDRIDFGNGDDELWNTVSASGRVVASGGAGRDYLGGGNQKDLMEGGTEADALGGGDGNDRLYGDAKGDTQAFATAGATQVGNGQQGEWFDGAGGDDQMFGGAGNDLVAGGAGDDRLEGGLGDDLLMGGTGLDTYDWHTGDGNDRIIDADRHGVIIIHDGMQDLFAAGAFIRQGTSEVWEQLAADGSALTLTHNSSWKLRIAGGAEITLDDDWQEGDFGIRRVEIPTQPPATDLTLQGDLKPLDTNPVADGVQEGYDALDNLKVGDEADPDREDTLYDSAGNDLIQGHGGNDTLNAWRGGADLLEGGAGSDVIMSEGGNDLLYADTQAPIAATLVQGETQPGTGERGDWLSAGADADTLVGAAGNDLLLGGEGEDLLIGGADRFVGDAGEAANDAGWRLRA